MSALVDQFGNAISSRQFMDASRNGGNRPSTPIRAFDPLHRLLSYRDWLTTSYLSDKLFANNGIVKGAICDKATLAVGNSWKPVFLGEDKEWGKEATKWLTEIWYPMCDVRGTNFDFATGLFLDSITLDRSGDSIILLTYSENGKFPMIQRIPPRQIGQTKTLGMKGEDVVTDGDYKGAIIRNGVILNRNERPIAYRKLGANEGEYEDIPAANIIQIFEPEWCEQQRGLPIFSASIEEFRDISQSGEWERKAMMIASAIGLIEYNDTGLDMDPNDPANILTASDQTSAQLNDIQTKTLDGGMVRYFRANAGHKLEQFVNARPGEDWENFNDRNIRIALAGANWPYALAWKPEGGNGTITRSELRKAKSSVRDRQSLLRPAARRQVGYAISVAMNNGLISKYRGKDQGGFLKWDFTMPAALTIDEGRDRKERREDFKMGLINLSDIVAEDGDKTYEDHITQRAYEIATRKRIVAEVKEATKQEITEREMMMLTPNEQPETEEKAPEKEKKSDE